MRLREKWHLYLLALVAVAVAVLAVLEIGPPSSSARTARELITAEDGVVQSTVSGTGNVEAGTDEDVNFRTSGTLEAVYVSTGQHVKAGQLLAQLNPASDQLSLDQAQESLTSAEDQLTATENGTASGSGSSGAGSSTGASYTGAQGSTEFVSATTTTKRTTTRPGITTRPSTPARSSTNASSSAKTTASSSSKSTTTTTPTTTTTTTTPSPSAIASAQAAVYGAQAAVDNAEQTLAETKLYAPVSGTIASMANLVPGDAVSGGSTSTVSGSSSSSSSSTGSGGSGAGGTSTAGSLGGSSGTSSSSGGSGSSSPFAEIVNTKTMSMTVAFSESDISKIKVGQPATITMDALAGVELAAHVSQISDVGTTSSSVVSYDATLTVDQTDPRVKPGMSASASVIVGQAQGVSVPNAAVTGGGSLASVNLDQGGKAVAHQVVVGLRGDSRTQIISGLSAGQRLVVTETLPSLSTSTTSTTSGSGTLGGGGLGGGGFFRGGGLAGGGGGFFRGGG